MPELKSITKEAVPGALAKAERYRLLNEPREAESICRDVLRVDPQNQPGQAMLLLALTDQFQMGVGVDLKHAQELLPGLQDEYERTYYAGVILERWAKAQLTRGLPTSVVRDWLGEAMLFYTQAEAIRPPGNDEAILRWNTCARMAHREAPAQPAQDRPEPGTREGGFDDEVPLL